MHGGGGGRDKCEERNSKRCGGCLGMEGGGWMWGSDWCEVVGNERSVHASG